MPSMRIMELTRFVEWARDDLLRVEMVLENAKKEVEPRQHILKDAQDALEQKERLSNDYED